ncbi:MAG TPA: hypothetical protein VNO35_25265 [Steroidobacteraceae bacterium]|nr:hypothetical protein [Steroidobacteraceae bacterium]
MDPKRRDSTRAKPAQPFSKRTTVATELLDVRQRLALAMAASYVCAAAIRAQAADSDAAAARVLQRHVCDEIDRQIERLHGLAARCQEGQS